jgi:F0F1-type ATP synthase membrane subunit c/vacuolar-type H+-ATPase subunit K
VEILMKTKFLRVGLIIMVAALLVLLSFGSGYLVGNIVPALKSALAPQPASTSEPSGTRDCKQNLPFWQADLVHQHM